MTAICSVSDLTARERNLGIAVAIACVSLVGVALSLSIPLLTFAMEARGASGTLIGLNTAMGGLATIAVAPLIARWAGIVGVRATLFAALALGAATILGFAVVAPLWAWFPLRFLFGASLAVLFVLSEFWINAFAPERARGLVMGVYATSLSVGFAAGPAILAVTGSDGLAAYLVCAGLYAAAALPVAFARGLAPAIEKPNRARGVMYFIAIAPLATGGAFVFGAVETGGFTFLPLFGTEVGLTVQTAALLVSMMAVGNIASQIPIGLVSDRVDRRWLILALAACGLAGAVAIPFVAHDHVALFALVAVWGGVVGGLYTVALAHLGARFSGVDLATANAAFVMMYSIGLMAGPPLLGVGFDLSRPHGAFYAVALLLGAYVVIAAFRIRREAAQP
ncbi:MFS transporter [Hansschlegelia sp. KR7-227]|uniref:MFS transporter n=1 Tax=Hansschlegelia sp. KR7-227 TaxID=3400914 RepID=UPI003C03A2CD